jgi:hypothetical protein
MVVVDGGCYARRMGGVGVLEVDMGRVRVFAGGGSFTRDLARNAEGYRTQLRDLARNAEGYRTQLRDLARNAEGYRTQLRSC